MRPLAGLLFLLFAGTPGVRAQGQAPAPARIRDDLARLVQRISTLDAEVRAVHVEGFIFNPEERFLDSQVSFDLGHWDEAAIQLFSLVEDSRFKADARYFDAVRMLAVSLYEMGNLEGARDEFEKLVAAGVEAGDALVYLVEIASRLSHGEDLRRYTQQVAALSGRSGSDRLSYAHGKALYLIGETTASWDALQGVAASSPLYVKARYLMGAILVSQSRLDEAVTAFEEVVARAAPAADAPIAELAYLSLARLAYEQGQISRAADLYQRIPFQSRNFQRALYEMTHLHIRSSGLRDNPDERFEDLRKALETLEILAGAPDLGSKLSVETAILRGRINMLLGMLNYANEAYKEVVDRFAPMSNELWEFSQDAERIGRWFESLVHEQVDPIGRFEVLSRDAAEWIREEPDLGQVVRSLQDLGQQKKDLEESAEILGKLRAALDQPGVRNLFPALRTAWLDSLELEAGLEDFGSQLLDWQQETLGKALTDEERQRIATLRAERELLEKQLKDKPRTAAGYEARDRASLEDLQEMERDLDEQLLRIQGYKDQVDAMLRVLREVKYKGSYDLEVRDEDDVRAELEKETAALAELYDQTLAVKLKVQRDMLLGSGGEEAARSEGDRQAALQAGQKEEAALYLEAARRAGASGNPLLQAAAEGQKIITSELVHLGEIRRLIDERAAMKVTFYRGMIEGEAKQLAVNATEFEQTERRSLEVARSMGTPLFLAANDRLGSVVLEADLGLVDLAWQRKQEYTEQLDFLGEEKGRKIGFLQKLLDEATQEVE